MNRLNRVTQIDKTSLLNLDIRYILFRAYIIFSGFLSLLFTVILLLYKRPTVNILTGLGTALFAALLFFLSRNQKHYAAARIIFLTVSSLIWLPFGYITSPGSISAMPYLVFLIVFIATVIVRNPWEYLFSGLMILQMPFLFYSEIWFPHWYSGYENPVERIQNLAINFTTTILAIALSIIFMMIIYSRFNRRMYDLSVLDDLTGLYNKRYLLKFLEMEHNRSLRSGQNYSLVFVDLDNFKRVNDNHGHLEGDKVLQQIAQIIQTSIRSYDISARYGGDEFVIVFTETDLEMAKVLMQRIGEKIKIFAEPYKEEEFSASWGIADNRDRTIEEVLSAADLVLYNDKNVKKQR